MIDQVDVLKAELLSERCRHEEACESARASHTSELTLERERHKEEVKKLQDEIEELKKTKNQVGG